MDKMSDIEKKKRIFLDQLKKRADIWNVGSFHRLVEEWFDEHRVDENGIADIKVSFLEKGDQGDELFDTMYEVEAKLKCGNGCTNMQYRHEPKKINGVVYVALENPLDINWRVNIGAISLDEANHAEEKQ